MILQSRQDLLHIYSTSYPQFDIIASQILLFAQRDIIPSVKRVLGIKSVIKYIQRFSNAVLVGG